MSKHWDSNGASIHLDAVVSEHARPLGYCVCWLTSGLILQGTLAGKEDDLTWK
jgi:hypothetical protein